MSTVMDTHACGCCRHLGVRGIEPLPDHIYPCHLPAEQIILPPNIRPEALGAYHRNFVLPTDGECCSFFENRTEQLTVPYRRGTRRLLAKATGERQ